MLCGRKVDGLYTDRHATMITTMSTHADDPAFDLQLGQLMAHEWRLCRICRDMDGLDEAINVV